MAPKFKVKNGKHSAVAFLTVSVAEEQQSRLERRISRHFTSQCVERGLAVRGTINVEVQTNCLTTTVDVTAAAFVEAIDGIATRLAKRPVASSVPAASAQRRRKISRQAIG